MLESIHDVRDLTGLAHGLLAGRYKRAEIDGGEVTVFKDDGRFTACLRTKDDTKRFRCHDPMTAAVTFFDLVQGNVSASSRPTLRVKPEPAPVLHLSIDDLF